MAPIDLDARSWMSKVPGHLTLSALSIPGSHDSTCRRGAVKPGLALLGGDFVYTQYQENDLLRQLEMGIRFLDYRVEYGGNLRHGSAILEGNLYDELRMMVQFLEQHQSECICVSVKWEKEEIDVWSASSKSESEPKNEAARVISEMVKVCGRTRLWLEPRIPTLDEARGKIVFLTRFEAVTVEGIRYYPGGEDLNNPNNPPFRSQDHYDLTDVLTANAPAVKFHQYVLPFIMQALASRNEKNIWYFNFTSGYAGNPPGWDHLNPVEIAWDYEFDGRGLTGVNTFLVQFLRSHPPGRIGTLLMDLVNPDLVKAVHDTNEFV